MRSPYEIKCQKELEAENWKTDWKVHPRRTPRGYQVDYFGLFDILSHKPGQLRWIAIKGHQGVPRELREGIEAFVLPEGCQKEIWTYGRNKKVRREVIK